MALASPVEGIWEALLGRGPDAAPLPADRRLWEQVSDRLNPARARPVLRPGVEQVALDSVRLGEYVMLRSPDGRDCSYVRLGPEEWHLVELMDGTRTVAQLVGEFATITGRLAPDQVLRVVADLAGGRMLKELPIDAFEPLRAIRRRPWPMRIGHWLLAAFRGKRFVVANPDRVAGFAYRFGGWLLFTRVGVACMALVATGGLVLFLVIFLTGAQSALQFGGSYVVGASVLLGLNVVGLLVHESGHALATKRAGRRVPASGFLCYFGIPSAFVDTTDLWMAKRSDRLVATAAGPGFSLVFAGAAQIIGLAVPPVAGLAFALGLVWYLNSLFNLNPLMALDGYYLFLDWFEVPNLRARGMVFIVRSVRRPSSLFAKRSGEERLVGYYAGCSLMWLVVMLSSSLRFYRDRFGSMSLALWGSGWGARALMVTLMLVLASPLVYVVGRSLVRIPERLIASVRERNRRADEPRRLSALRRTRLGSLSADRLTVLARQATWIRPRRGADVVPSGAAPEGVLAVVDGALEGRRPGDPPGHLRARADVGELVGVAEVLGGRPSSLAWSAAGTRLLRIPAGVFQRVVGPLVKQRAPVERAEIETLLEQGAAFAGMSDDLRLALASTAVPVDLGAGRTFSIAEGAALIVAAGSVDVAGETVHAGALIMPPSTGEPIHGITRTVARVWRLPADGPLEPLLGAGARVPSPPQQAPRAGMHGDAYAPLVIPWGARPSVETGDDPDAGLVRGARRALILLVLLALLALWFASGHGPAWAEIPEDEAVLRVLQGEVVATVDGERRVLQVGDEVLVSSDDDLVVARRSIGELEFRGGSDALLCPSSDILVGALESSGVGPIRVSAALEQRAGRVIVESDSTASSFDPLTIAINLIVDQGEPNATPPRPRYVPIVTNDGEARLATTLGSVELERGNVMIDGRQVRPTGRSLRCGDGAQGTTVEVPVSATTTTVPPTAVPSTTAPPTTVPPTIAPPTRRPPTTTTPTVPPTVPPTAAPPSLPPAAPPCVPSFVNLCP